MSRDLILFLVVLFVILLTASFNSYAELSKKERIALVIMCEDGRNEQSMLRVASVILNRASERSLNEVYRVVARRGQFSCYGLLNQFKARRNTSQFQTAINVVNTMLKPSFEPLFSATHFYNRELVRPFWSSRLELVYIDHPHVFLRYR